MIISNLFSAERNDGFSDVGISVGVPGLDHYNPAQSKFYNASSVYTQSSPRKVVATGAENLRLAWRPFGGCTPEAYVQAPLILTRDHRKYSFLFLSTD